MQLNNTNQPLAFRMRPRNLDEFFGQSHILSPGKLLWRSIKADRITSVIFYGPPGSGKTTLAAVIANTTKSNFIAINAVLSGVKEIRESIALAQKNLEEKRQKTILFIDEVHRFNKSQQDALLPAVEQGMIIFIGATTENPYFEVNKALISRSNIFQLNQLEAVEIEALILSSLKDQERGYGKYQITIADDALKHLSVYSNGDARVALNALEMAVLSSDLDSEVAFDLNLAIIEESIQKKAVLYDKDGDYHYDIISAFIKSIRGSDVDAALYWMAKMIYAGEDPRYIFRRMIISASEDIGLACPEALNVVLSCSSAFDYVGMPEGRFHLAQACIYLASAEKSNSAFAFFDALKVVSEEKDAQVPNHLKDGNRDKEGFGHGKGYLYPHAYQDHWINQQYLPEGLQGKIFYEPTSQGFEKSLSEKIYRTRNLQLEALAQNDHDENHDAINWVERTFGKKNERLDEIRAWFLDGLNFPQNAVLLNLNAYSGYLFDDFQKKLINPSFYFHCFRDQTKNILKFKYKNEQQKIEIIAESSLSKVIDDFQKEKIKFDCIIGYDVPKKDAQNIDFFEQIRQIMHQGGICRFMFELPYQFLKFDFLLDEKNYSHRFFEQINEYEQNVLLKNKNSFPLVLDDEIREFFQNATIVFNQKVFISNTEYYLKKSDAYRFFQSQLWLSHKKDIPLFSEYEEQIKMIILERIQERKSIQLQKQTSYLELQL